MPKTYKTEIIGYTFEELSEEVKKNIYENDDYFSQSIDFSPVEEEFRSMLIDQFGAKLGTLEVYYDVSYSQGSGACCVGALDVETVFKNKVGPYFTSLLKLIESEAVTIDAINIIRCGPSGFYSHENTCTVEIEYSCDASEVGDWDGEDVTELEEMLTGGIREELLNFHNELQDYYEDSTSFEAYCAVKDSDNVYTEDGKVVDPVLIQNSFVIDGYQLPIDFCDEEE